MQDYEEEACLSKESLVCMKLCTSMLGVVKKERL